MAAAEKAAKREKKKTKGIDQKRRNKARDAHKGSYRID